MDRKKPADSTEQIKILHEVPESLKKLTLYLTKIFYGLEQYVIMYYVQNNTIIKEEQVRDLCKIDQRQFRQFVTILKVLYLLTFINIRNTYVAGFILNVCKNGKITPIGRPY